MWKLVNFFLLPLLLMSQELEVHLPTRSLLKPLYLSSFPGHEELRDALEFDLNMGGFCTVLPRKEELEAQLELNLSSYKEEKIPYFLSAALTGDRVQLTAFNLEKGTSKTYPPIPLERQAIHRLADALQKDLFGREGIASLKLIFAQRTKNQTEKGLDWLSEIWICDADGANPKQVTAEKSYCLSPYFIGSSNDTFFYVSEKSGQSKIYRASVGGTKELLIDMRGNQALPSLSKKGDQIAFISDVAGRPDLFLQSLDAQGKMKGKPRQLFSAPRATQATPTFSPDGKRLAFVSDKDGPPRIYLLNLATSHQRPLLLTKKNRENTSPSWSPDGTKLAYSAKVDGVRQIWIYDFLTEEEIQLTTSPQNKENPSWAPDSFHLVYNTEAEDICELYLIHLNQAEPVKISKGPGQKRFASWQQKAVY